MTVNIALAPFSEAVPLVTFDFPNALVNTGGFAACFMTSGDALVVPTRVCCFDLLDFEVCGAEVLLEFFLTMKPCLFRPVAAVLVFDFGGIFDGSESMRLKHASR